MRLNPLPIVACAASLTGCVPAESERAPTGTDSVPARTFAAGARHDARPGPADQQLATTRPGEPQPDDQPSAAGLAFAPSSLTIPEGGVGAFDVTLAAGTEGPVTLTLDAPTDALSLTPTTLKFSPFEGPRVRTVTVTSLDDEIAMGPQSWTIGVTRTSADGRVSRRDQGPTVQVVDDDQPGILLDTSMLAAFEDAQYPVGVVLESQPRHVVWVELVSGMPDQATAREPVSFSPADWNVPKTFYIEGTDNLDNEPDYMFDMVPHGSSADPMYHDLVGSPLNVLFQDHEDHYISINTDTNFLSEGASVDGTVTFGRHPTASVAISLGSSSPRVSISPSFISIDPANYVQTHPITVTVANDSTAQPLENISISAVATSSDSNINGIDTTIPMELRDDDGPVVILHVTNVPRVVEGSSTEVELSLGQAPTDTVVVNLSPDASDVGVVPAQLSFDATNYQTPQTVTIEAADDELAERSASVEILVSFATTDAAYANATPDPIRVSRSDDDEPRVAILGPDVLEILEGTSENFDVLLLSEPAVPIVVDLAATRSAFEVSPTTLSFDGTNWSTPQQVTVSMPDDSTTGLDPAAWLVATLTEQDVLHWAFEDNWRAVVGLQGRDDDGPSLTILAPQPLVLAEGRRPDHELRLVARRAPTHDVTVTLTTSDPTQVSVTPSTVTITASDWRDPIVVSVSTPDDGAVEGEQAHHIAVDVSSQDPQFDALALPPVAVRVFDDESPAVVVRPLTEPELWGSVGSDPELANRSGVEVFLTMPPTDDVYATLWSTAPGEAVCDEQLVHFSPTDWDEVATVWVTSQDDGSAAGLVPFDVRSDPVVSDDAAFAGFDPFDLAFVCFDVAE